MISKLRSPVYVQVEITSDCNNKCLHCYNFWLYESMKPKRKSLSISEWKRVAEILGANDIFYVTVTGGEPFLEKEKFYRFLDFLCEQNIRIMINSNGALLDENDTERLKGYPIEIFLVSLLSHKEGKHDTLTSSPHSFRKSVNGIKLLKKAGLNVAVNTVATKLNYKEIFSTGSWLYNKLGVENFSATPICPSDEKSHFWLELDEKETFEVLHQLMRLRKELGQRVDILEALPNCLFANEEDPDIVEIFSTRMCTAGNTTITIGSEGDVRPCSFDHESYGNILTEDFKEIWDRMVVWRDNSLLPRECKECSIVKSCGGGCRVNSRIKTGYYCNLDSRAKGEIEEKRKEFFLKTMDVFLDRQYRLVNSISVRKETEDIFILIANPMQFVITDSNGFSILKTINTQPFVPKEIIARFNINEESGKKFFAELSQKGFLIGL